MTKNTYFFNPDSAYQRITCRNVCGLILSLIILFGILNISPAKAQLQQSTLKIGVAGDEPFVVNIDRQTGISLEIWQAIADMENVQYKLISYKNVPKALTALNNGELDAVVGPVSITPERAKHVKFTQPYYQSSISIMSQVESPSIWQRLGSFFTWQFIYGVLIFLFILAVVGLLFWLVERKLNPDEFSAHPVKGIGDGMWCAIVTMTTTGYGDIAPRGLAGRVIAGCWMIICIAFATTFIAGISSSLAISASSTNSITEAKQLTNKKVAVVKGSPAVPFVKKFGANLVYVETFKRGYQALKAEKVAAVVFDRPQMLYFLKTHKDEDIAVSPKRYMRQGYGFAFPFHYKKKHKFDIDLLKLQQSGRVKRMVTMWLGPNDR